MTRWAIGGAVLLAVAVGVARYGMRRAGPEVVVNAPVTPDPAPPVLIPAPPAEPTPLARVVDVTDIDLLLDPPTVRAAAVIPVGPVLTAVGYEEPAPAPAAAGDVPPIPPAVDDGDPVEVAPAPREVAPPVSLTAPLPVQLVRAG